MSLLGGGIAALFGELFSPLYLPATLGKVVETYDGGGRLQRGRTEYPCRAQIDSATERMQATEGYTATDRAVYILAATLGTSADTDCDITVTEGPYAGTLWRLASPIDRDPGGAYWLARAVRRNG